MKMSIPVAIFAIAAADAAAVSAMGIVVTAPGAQIL